MTLVSKTYSFGAAFFFKREPELGRYSDGNDFRPAPQWSGYSPDFGRLCSPHAWLSTWPGLSSNANLLKTLPGVHVPNLVVSAGCDRGIYPESDAESIFIAVGAQDRTFIEFPEARHYFEPEFGANEAPDVKLLMDRLIPWIEDRV